jgi:hypothetical protein
VDKYVRLPSGITDPCFQGLLLHPSQVRIRSILEDAADEAIIISRSSYIPSPAYLEARHPHALASYLSSIMPPPQPTTHTPEGSQATIKPEPEKKSSQTSIPGTGAKEGTTKFLGIPTIPGVPGISMGVMDVRKWGWSGMFGKQTTSKISSQEVQKEKEESEDVSNTTTASSKAPSSPPEPLSDNHVSSVGHGSSSQPEIDIHIDTASLAEAIESDTMHAYPASLIPLPPSEQPTPESVSSVLPPDVQTPMSAVAADLESEPPIEDQPPPPFSYITVHLSSSRDDPIQTVERRIAYLIVGCIS